MKDISEARGKINVLELKASILSHPLLIIIWNVTSKKIQICCLLNCSYLNYFKYIFIFKPVLNFSFQPFQIFSQTCSHLRPTSNCNHNEHVATHCKQLETRTKTNSYQWPLTSKYLKWNIFLFSNLIF